MKMKKLLISSCIGLLAIPMLVSATSIPTIPGVPSIPLFVYGSVSIDGVQAPLGTEISVEVEGAEVSKYSVLKVGEYMLEIPAEYSGDTLIFKVNSQELETLVCPDSSVNPSLKFDLSLTNASEEENNDDESNDTNTDTTSNTSGTQSGSGGGGGGGGGSEPILSNMSIAVVGPVQDNKVNLAITATGANMMSLSNNADFVGAKWEGFSTAVMGWSVASSTEKVYIKFRTTSMKESAIFSCVVSKKVSPVITEKNELENIIVKGEESPVFFAGNNLYGVDSETVEIVTADEAAKVLACQGVTTLSAANQAVYNKIIGNYGSDLSASAILSIKCFIQNGTQTTTRLGAGERAGVLNSFAAAFAKMPATETDWQDVVKIANGRWPKQRNAAYEEQMKTGPFVKVYKRSPNMSKPADSSAVVIMTYGLLPVNRNMNSEKASILTFKAIYGYSPLSALDWNIARAIAYSGAVR